MDRPAILAALLGWIRSGGPPHSGRPADAVPGALHDAVLGIGHPIRAQSTRS